MTPSYIQTCCARRILANGGFLPRQGADFGAETHLVTMLHLEMRNEVQGEIFVEVQTYVQTSLNSKIIVHAYQPAHNSWVYFGLLSRWKH